MNLRSIPRRTVVYAAVLVALLALYIVQESATSRRNAIAVPEIPGEITRVVLESGDDDLELRRTDDGDGWTVGDEQYPASEPAVLDLLDPLRSMVSLDVISARGNYPDFGLTGEEVRRVRVFAGDVEPIALTLGDTAAAGDAAYARINGSREVVLAPRAVAEAFSTDPADFRRRIMMTLEESGIGRVTIESDEFEPIVIEPTGEADNGWTAAGIDEVVDPGRFRDLFQELSSMRAQGFIDETPEVDPFVSLRIELLEGGIRTVRVWPPNQNGRYPVSVGPDRYPFVVPEWRVRRLVLGLDRYLEPFADDDQADDEQADGV